MIIRNGFLSLVLTGSLAFGFTACTLKKKDSSHLTIEVAGAPSKHPTALLMSPFEREEDGVEGEGFRLMAAPSSVSQFACLAVNVMGPGIPDSDPTNAGTESSFYDLLMSGSSFCSYRGVVGGPIMNNGAGFSSGVIDVTVPSGPRRIVQLLGVNDTTKCSHQPLFQGNDGAPQTIYEIGRAVVDTFTDSSATITSAWNSLTQLQRENRLVECENDGCGFFFKASSTTAGASAAINSSGNAKQVFQSPSAVVVKSMQIYAGLASGSATLTAGLFDATCTTVLAQAPQQTISGSAKFWSFPLSQANGSYYQLTSGTNYCIKVTNSAGSTVTVYGGAGSGATCNGTACGFSQLFMSVYGC